MNEYGYRIYKECGKKFIKIEDVSWGGPIVVMKETKDRMLCYFNPYVWVIGRRGLRQQGKYVVYKKANGGIKQLRSGGSSYVVYSEESRKTQEELAIKAFKNK